jgi:cyclopropane-fatty-acyl-phospholipid synthase
MRVAVVGAGLAGLMAAHELARSGGVRVTLYEKGHHLGGGAGTMAVDHDGGNSPVHLDLSFIVFNRVRTSIDAFAKLQTQDYISRTDTEA